MLNKDNHIIYIYLKQDVAIAKISPPNEAGSISCRCYIDQSRKFYKRLRFLSSCGSSSPSRSAVSAGLRSECTLLAILLLLVGGAEKSMFLNGNFGPGSCQPASLPTLA